MYYKINSNDAVGCFYENRYVEQLSRSLYVEYKYSGIDVQCQVSMNLHCVVLSTFLFIIHKHDNLIGLSYAN